jgi:hypothetical protein
MQCFPRCRYVYTELAKQGKELFVKKRILFVMAMGCLLSTFMSCGKRPPETVVIEKAKRYIEHSEKYCGVMVGMKDIQYDLMKVQYGKYNRKEKHWPVRVRVQFSAECGETNWGGEYKSYGRRSWDETLEMEVWLVKDDWGRETWNSDH